MIPKNVAIQLVIDAAAFNEELQNIIDVIGLPPDDEEE